MTPYATSDFQSHSLMTVIQVVSSAITSAIYIPMAKLVDMWGRAEAFALSTFIATVGMIILAASSNLPSYCAGQVFLDVGRSSAVYASEIVAIDEVRAIEFSIRHPWLLQLHSILRVIVDIQHPRHVRTDRPFAIGACHMDGSPWQRCLCQQTSDPSEAKVYHDATITSIAARGQTLSPPIPPRCIS